MTGIDCPYGAKDCPKSAALEQEIKEYKAELQELRTTQMDMQKMLYIIAGIVTTSLGVSIGGLL